MTIDTAVSGSINTAYVDPLSYVENFKSVK